MQGDTTSPDDWFEGRDQYADEEPDILGTRARNTVR